MKIILTALVLAAGLTGTAVADEAPEGGAWVDCTVSSVAAFRDRVIIHCAAPPPAKGLEGAGEGPPRDFGIESMGPLTDPVLRLAMGAKSAGRPLAILYVKDPVANPPGCPADRCRRIAGIELR